MDGYCQCGLLAIDNGSGSLAKQYWNSPSIITGFSLHWRSSSSSHSILISYPLALHRPSLRVQLLKLPFFSHHSNALADHICYLMPPATLSAPNHTGPPSLFSSMDDALLISKRLRSMPLHASSSWHLSITYMPPTPCSPSLLHVYLSLPPCLFLIIYTLSTICIPWLLLIIYTHIPYVFHTSTTPFPSI